MQRVVLVSPVDFAGWRSAARMLVATGVDPGDVEWTVAGEAGGLFGEGPSVSRAAATSSESAQTSELRVPAAFVDLARTVILHRDPDRFALLHTLLARVAEHREILRLAVDPEVARAEQMAKSVRHDMHKMTAFVRFREVSDVHAGGSDPVYVAWFEPTHHIVEATAPFFARRFANRRWSILTPERSVHWDGKALQFAPGADRSDAPDGDRLEDLWRTYYASIFNPARLKVEMMQKEMPRKYWRNLPEAELIAPLIAGATSRMQGMIDEPPTEPPWRRMEAVAQGTLASRAVHARERVAVPIAFGTLASLGDAREAAKRCRECPLWEPATQTVFGEGSVHARVMLVGEQAGDQEDLAGRPFVGPAGRLLDRALDAAGIAREKLYVTNAVKHFKFVSKGKRRIHQRPADAEIDACYPWLDLEMQLVRPSLVVALGATAARALTGRTLPVNANRGRIIDLPGEPSRALTITVHPSYLLRIPEDAQAQEFERFVADLAQIRPWVDGRAADSQSRGRMESTEPPGRTPGQDQRDSALR